jgi:hypothetical protein
MPIAQLSRNFAISRFNLASAPTIGCTQAIGSPPEKNSSRFRRDTKAERRFFRDPVPRVA